MRNERECAADVRRACERGGERGTNHDCVGPSVGVGAAAIVGVWVGVHQCQRIMDVMTAAGMPEQGLLNIIDAGTLPGVGSVEDIPDPAHPCVGAIEVKHSHFFTAGGEFGSRDAIGTRVDDGTWRMADSDTILIGDVSFDFTIENDGLRLVPLDVGTCPTTPLDWCEEAWKLMVAMPGLEWRRG